MTVTSVEYEETVTREEELRVCDDCNREVDENGKRLTSPDCSISLDYCSECLSEIGKDVAPPYVERAEDWLDTSVHCSGIRQKLGGIIRESRTIVTGLFATGTILGLLLLAAMVFFDPPVVGLLALYSLGGWAAIGIAKTQIDEVKGVYDKVEREVEF